MKLFFFALVIIIYISAWIIQDHLFLNWDVSMLMNASKQWLAGGSYRDDFFTPNPPMILYLYLPPLFLNKLSSINVVIAFRLYLFLLASISFLACYYLMTLSQQTLFNHAKIRYLFLSTLLAVFLILPFYQFGQRDHLLFIFTAPYLFMLAARRISARIHPYFATACGFFAGLGLAIKPQFLILPLLMESYFAYQQKTILAWFRPEVLAIMGWLSIYAVLVFIVHPDYIFIIAPYMLEHYYSNVSTAWLNLIFNDTVFFCCFTLCLAFLLQKDNPYKILKPLLTLALIGFLLIYFSQRTFFFYHLIPAFSTALLLLFLVLAPLIKKEQPVLSVIALIFIYSFPLYAGYHLYLYGIAYKNESLNPLIAFMKTQAPRQSIYVLSEANYSSPLIDYTETTVAERFDCLWMVESLVKQKENLGGEALRHYLRNNNDTYFFVNLIADDLHKHQPNLVFVDVKEKNIWLSGHITYFDYLDYFLENKNFRDEWKSYRYLTTITNGSHYKLNIYKRIVNN